MNNRAAFDVQEARMRARLLPTRAFALLLCACGGAPAVASSAPPVCPVTSSVAPSSASVSSAPPAPAGPPYALRSEPLVVQGFRKKSDSDTTYPFAGTQYFVSAACTHSPGNHVCRALPLGAHDGPVPTRLRACYDLTAFPAPFDAAWVGELLDRSEAKPGDEHVLPVGERLAKAAIASSVVVLIREAVVDIEDIHGPCKATTIDGCMQPAPIVGQRNVTHTNESWGELTARGWTTFRDPPFPRRDRTLHLVEPLLAGVAERSPLRQATRFDLDPKRLNLTGQPDAVLLSGLLDASAMAVRDGAPANLDWAKGSLVQRASAAVDHPELFDEALAALKKQQSEDFVADPCAPEARAKGRSAP